MIHTLISTSRLNEFEARILLALYYVKTGDDLLTDKAGVGVIR